MNSKDKDALRGGLSALFGDEQPQEEAISVEVAQPKKTAAQPSLMLENATREELEAALKLLPKRGPGRPRKDPDGALQSEKYGRICTIVNLDQMAKMREIARRETLQIKEVVEAAFDLAISRYEQRHGRVRIPKRAVTSADELFDVD